MRAYRSSPRRSPTVATALTGRWCRDRSQGALLTDSDEIARRVVELVTTGRLTAVDGSTIVIEAESVCLHGDTPGAVEHARTTRAALLSAGVSLAPITRH